MVQIVSKLMCLVCLGSGAHAQSLTNARRLMRERFQAGLGKTVTPPVPVSNLILAECDSALNGHEFKAERRAMRVYKEQLPKIFGQEWVDAQSWSEAAAYYAGPAIERESPALVMTYFGPPNTWKSTLTNMTLATMTHQTRAEFKDVAPVSSTGGSTRRALVFVSPDPGPGADSNIRPEVMADINERYANPALVERTEELTEQGEPRLVEVEGLSPKNNIVIVDAADPLSGDLGDAYPDYKRQAERAVVSADVLTIMLDPSNYRRPDTKKALQDMFKKYGRKRSIVVWRGWGDIDEHSAEDIRRHVQECLSQVYETNPNEMPAPVLAIYWTPDIKEVAKGDEFPVLHPLPGYKHYPDLLTEMSETAEAIKLYSIRDALARIEDDITDVIYRELKERRASRIYREGLDRLIDTVARQTRTGYPKGEPKRELRKLFFKATQYAPVNAIREKMEGFGDIARSVQKMFKGFFSREEDQEKVRVEQSISRTDLIRALLHEMRAQLKSSQIQIFAQPIRTLPDGQVLDGGRLELMLQRYAALSGPSNSRVPEVHASTAPGGKVQLDLPSVDDLPATVREKLIGLSHINSEKAYLELNTRLNVIDQAANDEMIGLQRQVKKTVEEGAVESLSDRYRQVQEETERAKADLKNVFAEKVSVEGTKRVKNMDVVGIVSLLGGVGSLASNGFQFTGMNLTLSLGGAAIYKGIKYGNDLKREAAFNRLLNEYFGDRQYETTTKFLNEMFGDLKTSLSPGFDERAAALDLVKDALRLTGRNPAFASEDEGPFEVLSDETPLPKKLRKKIYAPFVWVKDKVRPKPRP